MTDETPGQHRLSQMIAENLNANITDRPKLTLLEGGKPNTKAYNPDIPVSEQIKVSAMSNGMVRVMDQQGRGWELDPMLALNVSMQMQAMGYYFLDQYFATVRHEGIKVTHAPKIDVVRGSLPKNIKT